MWSLTASRSSTVSLSMCPAPACSSQLLPGQRMSCNARLPLARSWLPARRPAGRQGRHTQVTYASQDSKEVDVKTKLSNSDWVQSVDEEKEGSRAYKRTVFADQVAWRKHRSAGRYLRHVLGLFESRVIRGLGPPLLWLCGLSLAVASYETARETGVMPYDLPSIAMASKEPLTLTSFALSLLLVFRTNTSYGRWDEARKMWGLLLNRSRDLARQGMTWFDPRDSELRQLLRRWQTALAYSLKSHLRCDTEYIDELKNIMKPEELEALVASPHKPNYCLQMLSEIVRTSEINPLYVQRMDENIMTFADIIGGCERIMRTPVPLSYTRHTSRFLSIYLSFLPFTLWNQMHWGMVPVITMSAFLLLGIEEIGVSIEEPFTILALEAISGSVRDGVQQTVDRDAGVRDFVKKLHGGRPAGSERAPASPAASSSNNGSGGAGSNGSGNNGAEATEAPKPAPAPARVQAARVWPAWP